MSSAKINKHNFYTDKREMKFEEIIKSISTLVAALVIFVFATGGYLSLKGFVPDGKGGFVLMKNAQAAAPADQAEQAAKVMSMVLPKGHVLGKASAPITIYEYSSFACTHCSEFHLDMLPRLKENFIDKGLVKLVFVDFPLDKKSMYGSLVSRCVKPAKYHQFVTLLFKKQREWALSSKYEKVISQYALLSGLSNEELKACMNNEETIGSEILSNRGNAIEFLKIQGTPSFLIVKGNDREVLHGLPSYGKLAGILNEKLGVKEKN